MLGMACIFITVRAAGDPNYVVHLAIGMAYILFMLGFCKLIMLRNKCGKGVCFVATLLGSSIIWIVMAFPSARDYRIAFTDPTRPLRCLWSSRSASFSTTLLSMSLKLSIGLNR